MITIKEAYDMYMEIEKLREHNVGINRFCNQCETSNNFMLFYSLMFTIYNHTVQTRTDYATGVVLMDCDIMDTILTDLLDDIGEKLL